MPHLSPDELRAVFTEAGFAEIAEALIAKSRPGVSIEREVAAEDSIAIGASKLGGSPDLPQGMEWPLRDGRPLAFLGQFALADVPVVDSEPALPRTGLLTVFFDAVEQPWGFDPADRGAWLTLVVPTDDLSRIEAPDGAYEDEPFTACRVRYEAVTTYPDMDQEMWQRDDAEEIAELFDETVKEGQGEETPRHQLLGHPLVIQNEMEEECQLVSNGLYCGEGLSKEDEARAEALAPGASDWTLLLQLDTDDDAEWMWGDMGILYFWVRKQELERGDLSSTWCILQCS